MIPNKPATSKIKSSDQTTITLRKIQKMPTSLTHPFLFLKGKKHKQATPFCSLLESDNSKFGAEQFQGL
jgi:hypothetical protein